MKQFIKFGIVGASNTILAYIIYVVSLKIFDYARVFEKYGYVVASVIAFLISVLWSFYWNNRFTFKKKETEDRSLLGSLIRTYISYSITGLLLHNVLLYVLVTRLGVSEYVAYLLNLSITIPLNFILNKFWAFKSI